MNPIIRARHLSKSYGSKLVLDDLSFNVEQGQVVGLIGCNGAGKTTLLKSLLGLNSYEGELRLLNLNPYKDRIKLLEKVSFIADVATLPRWMKVSEILDYMLGVHPYFKEEKFRKFIGETSVSLNSKIGQLSKGMVTQVHLALILSIDSKILILDEPTLGLDVLNRKSFYDSLLNHYYNDERTIIITSHQVEEIENILTHTFFIDKGKIILNRSLKDLKEDYFIISAESEAAIKNLREAGPLFERKRFDKYSFVFEKEKKAYVESFGDFSRINLTDLFASMVGGKL